MSAQLKSQLLGLSLAVFTAVGCLAYERIVKNFSFFTVGFLACTAYVPFFLLSLLWNNQVKTDLGNLCQHRYAILIYLISGATGPLWYFITRSQDVMVGSIYEVKYIVILAVLYVFAGSRPMNWNTGLGVCLALASIYFISKK